jgi:hypothetical protein
MRFRLVPIALAALACLATSGFADRRSPAPAARPSFINILVGPAVAARPIASSRPLQPPARYANVAAAPVSVAPVPVHSAVKPTRKTHAKHAKKPRSSKKK